MKCSFCDSEIKLGTGKMYVTSFGKIYFFCSSKCEKNFLMNRSLKVHKWLKNEIKNRNK
ncbi:MAG: 50S ribosomal protein L24e [Candidatus Aenigmatarchaeota archaeon]